MKTPKTDIRWTPVRKGDEYCSPGCGRGCTLTEHQLAQEKAATLVRRLGVGEGWSPRVWENLGWHFSATKNGCAVHQNGSRSFWASLMFADRQFVGTGTTPKKAVDMALNIAENLSMEIKNDIEEFVK